MATESKAHASPPWHRQLRGTLWTVGAVYLFDALFAPTGLIAFTAGLILLLIGLYRAHRRHERGTVLALRVVLPFVLVTAVWGTIVFNGRMAVARSKVVIAACEAYAKDHNGSYPPDLNAVVPKYLPDIPLASYTITLNRFGYSEYRGKHNLEYRVWLRRRYYNFEDKEHTSLD